jgi:hypothetical protein
MCSACGFPEIAGHWTDAGAKTPADRMRNRFLRLVAVNRMLAPLRLTAHDDGATPGFQLRTASGTVEIVPDLEALWAAAHRLSGQTVDPRRTRPDR